jgi:poly(A) polymerase Pap1
VKQLIHILGKIEDELNATNERLEDDSFFDRLREEISIELTDLSAVEEEISVWKEKYEDHIEILTTQKEALDESISRFNVIDLSKFYNSCCSVNETKEASIFDSLGVDIIKSPVLKQTHDDLDNDEDSGYESRGDIQKASAELIDHAIVEKYKFSAEVPRKSFPKDFR